MKHKIFAFLTAGVMTLNLVGFAGAAEGKVSVKRQVADPLVALLPASDGVAVLDAERFFSVGLPQVLSANQPMLSAIIAKIDEIQSKTGIDLRKFEHVAVGVTIRSAAPGRVSLEPVAIARGTFTAGGLVAVARLASNGTYREEKIGARTIYVFSAKQAAQKNLPKATGGKASAVIEKTLDGLTSDIAVTSLDSNTLALGSPARVRQTLEARTKVDPAVVSLLSRDPGSIMSFAAKTPAGLSKFVPIDNDELGKNLDSIRFMAGSMDVAEGSAIVRFMARTQKADQAQTLLETLEGLQAVGKAFLGGAPGADKQVYARMIDNAKFAVPALTSPSISACRKAISTCSSARRNDGRFRASVGGGMAFAFSV